MNDVQPSGEALPLASLTRWLTQNVEGFAGPLTVDRFQGGQSNPTYRLTSPSGAYVLRRKPMGPLLKGAHAVDREFRVLSALSATDVPTPKVFALCTDDAVIGSAFYVMEMVDGRVVWDPTFPRASPADRRASFGSMNRTIAALHNVKPQDVGLADFGRPEGYLLRQIGRWSNQYLNDEAAGRDPNMDRLVEWLPNNAPSREESSIVHGDFRCDNMIFDPVSPEVIAVLDWELSTLGDPIVDFTYHCMMYRLPSSISNGMADRDVAGLNIPPEPEYVADYCARTGRRVIDDYDFYIAFNMFRFAAILHGIKGRLIRGNAASAHAADMAAKVEPLAELAWSQALRAS